MPSRAASHQYPAEFDGQLAALLSRSYPRLLGLTEQQFKAMVMPLRKLVDDLPTDGHPGQIAFVLVLSGLSAPGAAIGQVDLHGEHGFTTMEADDIARFTAIGGVGVPDGPAYLLVDVDTGRETLNVTPDDALDRITASGRSPLTIDEGIAVITHFPEVLRTHNAFSMLGSRCGDRRVTALWVSEGRPRLGWCWAGNPHTWLGSASCRARVGV